MAWLPRRRFRRPKLRREWRYVLLLLPAAVVVADRWVTGTLQSSHSRGTLVAFEVVGALASLALLYWRARWPAVALALTAVFSMFSNVAMLLWFVGLVLLCARRRAVEIVPNLAWMFVCELLLKKLVTAPEPNALSVPLLVDAVYFAVPCAALSAFGLYRGARDELIDRLRERAETAQREEVLKVALASSSERARIATDIHDVLAGQIELIVADAQQLTELVDTDLCRVPDVAARTQEASHQALVELRQALGVLRSVDDPEGAQPPSRDKEASVRPAAVRPKA